MVVSEMLQIRIGCVPHGSYALSVRLMYDSYQWVPSVCVMGRLCYRAPLFFTQVIKTLLRPLHRRVAKAPVAV